MQTGTNVKYAVSGFTGMGAVMDQGTRSVGECAQALRTAYA